MRLYDISNLSISEQEYNAWLGGFEGSENIGELINQQPSVDIPECLADLWRVQTLYDEEQAAAARWQGGETIYYQITFPYRQALNWTDRTDLFILIKWMASHDHYNDGLPETISGPLNWDENNRNWYEWFCAWRCVTDETRREHEDMKRVARFIWEQLLQYNHQHNDNSMRHAIEVLWID